MPPPVDLVTVHHEGAGAPSNDPRGAGGGYTYWIGATVATWLRDVWSSYATLNFNGDSVDVCLSGDRHTGYRVTDADLELIADALADARARGYVVDRPTVRAHRDSPGSSTVCPGNHTMARFPEVVAACTAGGTPADEGGTAMPAPTDVVDVLTNEAGTWQLTFDGGVRTVRGRFYGSYPGLKAEYRKGSRGFRAITERPDKVAGYTEWADDGTSYSFGPDTAHLLA